MSRSAGAGDLNPCILDLRYQMQLTCQTRVPTVFQLDVDTGLRKQGGRLNVARRREKYP